MDKELANRIFDRIAKKYQIRIIFACEWGSRAYGMERDSSDYDARFVYINTRASYYDSYLNIKRNSDRFNLRLLDVVKIERETITNKSKEIYRHEGKLIELDWQGWDITMAVKKLHELNPSIIEWAYSPIVYMNRPDYNFLETAQRFIEAQNRIAPVLSNYKSMGKKYWIDHIGPNKYVKIKKYAVAVRCCLMFVWLKTGPRKDLIKVNIYDVIEDIETEIPHKQMVKIYEMLFMKRTSDSADDTMKRRKALDELMRETFFSQGNDTLKKFEAKESHLVKFNHIQKYNKYLYACLEKHFNQ